MTRLLITRRLPDRVLDAARARFEVTLRDDTAALSIHRPFLPSRMRRLEHAAQAFPAHMCVELGGREIGVSE